VIVQTPDFRVVWPDEPGQPGLLRVIAGSHVAEMTDLRADDRSRLMDAVWTVESVMRKVLAPDKINLASLGNVVPHLHWHVVPRWRGDRQFPASIWSAVQSGREASSLEIDQRVRARLDLLFEQVARAFGSS
jgi:diadenosine tetraphosphate (Ap4A) HIT family hydrolase